MYLMIFQVETQNFASLRPGISILLYGCIKFFTLNDQNMFLKLLILFIVIPIIEIAILVKMGTLLGFWPTMLIVIATGILGATLARIQGFLVLTRIRTELQMGRMPAEELIDGLLILIGGILLLTPGLLTDLIGFLMLIQWSRKLFKEWLGKRFKQWVKSRNTRITNVHGEKP